MQLPEPIGPTTVTQRASDRLNGRARHDVANQSCSAVRSPGPSRCPEKGHPGARRWDPSHQGLPREGTGDSGEEGVSLP